MNVQYIWNHVKGRGTHSDECSSIKERLISTTFHTALECAGCGDHKESKLMEPFHYFPRLKFKIP